MPEEKSHWQQYKDHLANPPNKAALGRTIYHLQYDAQGHVVSCEAHKVFGDDAYTERKVGQVYGGGHPAQGKPVWSETPVEVWQEPTPEPPKPKKRRR